VNWVAAVKGAGATWKYGVFRSNPVLAHMKYAKSATEFIVNLSIHKSRCRVDAKARGSIAQLKKQLPCDIDAAGLERSSR
jgi:hypothetical protein